jgi:phosphatidylserine/phosphatidylglycerophosphate/cardiolipin synthase-like enzyme
MRDSVFRLRRLFLAVRSPSPATFIACMAAAFGLGVRFSDGIRAGLIHGRGERFPEELHSQRNNPLTVPSPDSMDVWFSPRGGCTEAVVRSINASRHTIRMQAYSFTSSPIAEALVQAAGRGVNVIVILDKSHRSERASVAAALHEGGISVLIDQHHSIAHNKVIIIDGERVLTGSFNFTKAAEGSNAENLLSLRDPQLASLYAANWETHRAHSEPYRSASRSNIGTLGARIP